jgi:hypothetical protein
MCGGTIQTNWALVLRSLLLGNTDPKIALTGSSSSKVMIKATLFRIKQTQYPHEGEPRDYNIDHFIHLRVAVEI